MALKDNIFQLLSSNCGKYISGEHIASLFNVSRNAVWKSINSIRKQGYIIYASQNKGYMMEDTSLFSAEKIKNLLNYPLMVEYYPAVTSTNDLVLEKGRQGEKEGLVVAANYQSDGRGRKNRVFYSPSDSGLYFSILLRPNIHYSKAVFITTAAAVSVCRAFERLYNIKADIKWVNDIFISSKKVCGILTEARINMESSTVDYVVLGIGINLFEPYDNFPNDILESAGYIFKKDKFSSRMKTELCAEIINNFWENYKQLEEALFLQDYIDRSLVTGKNILVENNGKREKAYVLGIDNNFRLQVKYENGQCGFIDSGEVSLIL